MNNTIYYLATVPFESACRIDILPEKHPSAHLHGHSYTASVRVPMSPPPEDGEEPVKFLKEHLKSTIEPLNYDFLNNHLEIPTDENLARWVHEKIDLEGIDRVDVAVMVRRVVWACGVAGANSNPVISSKWPNVVWNN